MFPSRLFSGLLTDLYKLTMAGYLQNTFEARASFEFFVRHLLVCGATACLFLWII